jgi:hypothetical protein
MPKPAFQRATGLTPQQHAALDLLALGRPDAAVAAHTGVARETVTRWRLYDPAFRAALQARRDDLWQDARAGLQSLVPAALNALQDQLLSSEHRGRLALDLLRAAGALTPTPPATSATPNHPKSQSHSPTPEFP